MIRRLLVGLALALTVTCLVVTIVGRSWLHDRAAEEHRRTAVTEAARSAVTAVLSYDYRSLGTNIASAEPLLTGDAKKQYREVSAPLLSTAPGIQAITKATVRTSTVLSSGPKQAEVLLFVDQTSSSTSLKTPRVDQSRILVTLTRSGQRWLVSTLTAV